MSERNAVELFEETILDKYLPRIFPDLAVRNVIEKILMDVAGKKYVVDDDEVKLVQEKPLTYLIWKLRSLGGEKEKEKEKEKYIDASNATSKIIGIQKDLLQKIMSLAFSIYQNEDWVKIWDRTRVIQHMGRLLPPPLPKRISPHRILSKSTEDLVIRSEGLGPGAGVQPPSPGPAPPPFVPIPFLSPEKMSNKITEDIKKIKNKQTLSQEIIEIIKEELNNMRGDEPNAEVLCNT